MNSILFEIEFKKIGMSIITLYNFLIVLFKFHFHYKIINTHMSDFLMDYKFHNFQSDLSYRSNDLMDCVDLIGF